MTQEKWQDTLVSIKNKVCTARNAKIAAAFCIVCVVAPAATTICTSSIWHVTLNGSTPWSR